jgi:hypothetical protein
MTRILGALLLAVALQRPRGSSEGGAGGMSELFLPTHCCVSRDDDVCLHPWCPTKHGEHPCPLPLLWSAEDFDDAGMDVDEPVAIWPSVPDDWRQLPPPPSPKPLRPAAP